MSSKQRTNQAIHPGIVSPTDKLFSPCSQKLLVRGGNAAVKKTFMKRLDFSDEQTINTTNKENETQFCLGC